MAGVAGAALVKKPLPGAIVQARSCAELLWRLAMSPRPLVLRMQLLPLCIKANPDPAPRPSH